MRVGMAIEVLCLVLGSRTFIVCLRIVTNRPMPYSIAFNELVHPCGSCQFPTPFLSCFKICMRMCHHAVRHLGALRLSNELQATLQNIPRVITCILPCHIKGRN
ncbi:hypothetical protein F5Y06DRAFT_131549 [Hypoxylon sp. FL0890]|nr:hypothetical protein F5Y06DRAFT_131549 [Hypoxylon sp. FL0890]